MGQYIMDSKNDFYPFSFKPVNCYQICEVKREKKVGYFYTFWGGYYKCIVKVFEKVEGIFKYFFFKREGCVEGSFRINLNEILLSNLIFVCSGK